ncbi:unnamed protein product, partial [Ectocarpus sp. 4 AP-2014]
CGWRGGKEKRADGEAFLVASLVSLLLLVGGRGDCLLPFIVSTLHTVLTGDSRNLPKENVPREGPGHPEQHIRTTRHHVPKTKWHTEPAGGGTVTSRRPIPYRLGEGSITSL